MSPIYTRPIREQLEHDRVIRQLQARYKRKHEVAINPGAEQNQSVAVGDMALYPDLVLLSLERTRHLEATVEVETGESVHLLEARAEWGNFARLPAPLFLYVPPQAVETARRICDDQGIQVSEIWTYHTTFDQQVRFNQVYKSPNPVKVVPPPPVKAAPAAKVKAAAAAAAPAKTVATPVKAATPAAAPGKPASKTTVKPAAKAASQPPAKAKSVSHGAAKPVAKVIAKAVTKAAAKAAPKPVARLAKAAPAKPGKAVKPTAKAKSASSSKKTVSAKKRR